jgi:HEPN domain-containing protein
VKEWFKKANSDLKIVKLVLKEEEPELEIACFHCQQAAEKALKGYLVFHDVEPQRTHDLEKLCKLCMEYDNSFSGILVLCSDLTEYAVLPRYPCKEFNVTETKTQQAFENAQTIYDFCWTKIFN